MSSAYDAPTGGRLTLETYEDPAELYWARGEEVNDLRPVFTGDVFLNVPIPGIQEDGMAMTIAHPCSMRRTAGKFRQRILVAPVCPSEQTGLGPAQWTSGYFNWSPLPELQCDGALHLARIDDLGQATPADLAGTQRLACLSGRGISLLHQRLIWYLTRLAVETSQLFKSFEHVFDEVELLEEWKDVLCGAGIDEERATSLFDDFICGDKGNKRTLQKDLREAQRRPSVRSACRSEAARIAKEWRSAE